MFQRITVAFKDPEQKQELSLSWAQINYEQFIKLFIKLETEYEKGFTSQKPE